MAVAARYIIVSPVKDEATHVERTLAAVTEQSLLPIEWVMVDDGSKDGTEAILQRYAKRFEWIKIVRRQSPAVRSTGAKVIEVFYEGLHALQASNWEFVVKLDCDLSFGQDYFERLFGWFARDDRLGIASGIYFELGKSGEWKEIRMPEYHAAGACKAVRRECFEEIGGFVVSAGWDTVDEIRAINKGWKTTHFRELGMKHHKPEGSGIGTIRTSIMHGKIFYLTGGSGLFLLFKAFLRSISRPYLLGAMALTWGYVRAAAAGTGRLVTEEEAECYRKLLWGRVMRGGRRRAGINVT